MDEYGLTVKELTMRQTKFCSLTCIASSSAIACVFINAVLAFSFVLTWIRCTLIDVCLRSNQEMVTRHNKYECCDESHLPHFYGPVWATPHRVATYCNRSDNFFLFDCHAKFNVLNYIWIRHQLTLHNDPVKPGLHAHLREWKKTRAVTNSYSWRCLAFYSYFVPKKKASECLREPRRCWWVDVGADSVVSARFRRTIVLVLAAGGAFPTSFTLACWPRSWKETTS